MLGNEKGSVMVMASIVVVVALLFLACLLDLGRAWVLRARIQAATDAASLAAISTSGLDVITEFVPAKWETRRYEVGKTLPPQEERIGEPRPIYSYTSSGRRVLEGYDVDVITEWEERVVDYRIMFDQNSGDTEAVKVLLKNADEWKKAEPAEFLVLPEIERSDCEVNNSAAKYRLWTKARIQSLLIGPVMSLLGGAEGPRHLEVRTFSESTASAGEVGEP
ncbi:MAG: pilus assembly protein TadG-related protein [Anaerolineae bacterium]